MTNGISAGASLPAVSNTLTNAAVSKASATKSASSNGMDASNIGSTFLNLLTQELQNQDPTSPMDSTAMVGQMISLNSLSQLVSINQTLSNASGSSNTSSSSHTQQAIAESAKDITAAAVQAAATQANPLSYVSLMNQFTSNPATAAASASTQSMLNATSAIR